jgi:hypothetical protein
MMGLIARSKQMAFFPAPVNSPWHDLKTRLGTDIWANDTGLNRFCSPYKHDEGQIMTTPQWWIYPAVNNLGRIQKLLFIHKKNFHAHVPDLNHDQNTMSLGNKTILLPSNVSIDASEHVVIKQVQPELTLTSEANPDSIYNLENYRVYMSFPFENYSYTNQGTVYYPENIVGGTPINDCYSTVATTVLVVNSIKTLSGYPANPAVDKSYTVTVTASKLLFLGEVEFSNIKRILYDKTNNRFIYHVRVENSHSLGDTTFDWEISVNLDSNTNTFLDYYFEPTYLPGQENNPLTWYTNPRATLPAPYHYYSLKFKSLKKIFYKDSATGFFYTSNRMADDDSPNSGQALYTTLTGSHTDYTFLPEYLQYHKIKFIHTANKNIITEDGITGLTCPPGYEFEFNMKIWSKAGLNYPEFYVAKKTTDNTDIIIYQNGKPRRVKIPLNPIPLTFNHMIQIDEYYVAFIINNQYLLIQFLPF